VSARAKKSVIDAKGNLLLDFRLQDTGIQKGDSSATLTGRSLTTGALFGTGTFTTVPK